MAWFLWRTMTLDLAAGAAGDRNRLRNYSTGKWIGSSPAIERALNFCREIFLLRKLASTDAMYAPDVWGEWTRLMRAGDIGIGQGGSWEWAEFWPEAERPFEKVAVEGTTAAEAMQWYKNKLIEEFGEDQVEIISS